ncbi:MAG: site-2 protease family protein [Candidatus Gracilibacteria bacterium]|jgi:regulator of sigma E protease|nr:site-2 protease family protein [Candidatus Gracilibacteria bacterium]
MIYLQSIIAFILIFSVLIIIHELGHFLAARKVGIRVEEFGFGLPPKVWGKKTKSKVKYRDKTKTEEMIWSINAIPFGGFVKMLGEDDMTGKSEKDPHSFNNAPIWGRILVVCAGVIMNFILGIALFTMAYSIGADPIITGIDDLKANIEKGVVEIHDGVQLLQATEYSQEKGLQAGDIIQAVDNTSINTPQELDKIIEKGLTGGDMHFLIKRGDDEVVKIFTPESIDEIGLFNTIPPIKKVNKIKLAPHKAFVFATTETTRISAKTVGMLGDVVVNIVRNFKPPEGVAGPVGIAKMTHTLVEIGDFVKLIIFMGLISVSLAVVNIMPFPALDGGRLLFLLAELITGQKPKAKHEALIHTIGFGLLLMLIILVTFNDIRMLFKG